MESLDELVCVCNVNLRNLNEVIEAIAKYDGRLGAAFKELATAVKETSVKDNGNLSVTQRQGLKLYALNTLRNLISNKYCGITDENGNVKAEYEDILPQIDTDLRTVTEFIDYAIEEPSVL